MNILQLLRLPPAHPAAYHLVIDYRGIRMKDNLAMRTAHSAPRTKPAMALASLSLTMLLPSLGISIANIALPTLATSFGASFQQVQWVVLAFLLAMSTSLVSVGRLGDLVGRRRLVLGGIVLFVAGSVLCALAPSLPLLVAARAVQGLGAAVMMALTLALAAETVSKNRTGSAMGMLATMSAAGTALGPSLGGLLIGWFGWPAIFLINVPLGLLAFAMVFMSLPATASARLAAVRFDHLGTLVLALTLGAYATAMTLGRGRFGAVNAALLLVAVAGALLFVRVEARSASPLLRLSILRDAHFSSSFASSALVATVVMATLVVGPFYLAGALGLSAAATGLAMSAGPLVAVVMGMPAGRLVDHFGHKAITRTGLYAMAAGSLSLALPPLVAGAAGYIGPLVVITGGYALFQSANNTAVMANVAQQQRGVISGVLTLSRNLGLISGASLMGAVFAHGAGTADVARAAPSAIATGMHLTYAVATLMLVGAILIARAAGRRQVTPSQPAASARGKSAPCRPQRPD